MPSQKPATVRRIFLCISLTAVLCVTSFYALLSPAIGKTPNTLAGIVAADSRFYEPLWFDSAHTSQAIALPGGTVQHIGGGMQDMALSLDSSLLFHVEQPNGPGTPYSLFLSDFTAPQPALIAENITHYYFSAVSGTVYYSAGAGAAQGLFMYKNQKSVQLAASAQSFVVSANEAHILYRDDENLYTLAVGAQPQVLLHNALGAFPVAISSSGRTAYYATSGNTPQAPYTLHCEQLHKKEQAHTLQIPPETPLRLLFNFNGEEMLATMPDALYTYNSSSGFSKTEAQNPRLYHGAPSLAVWQAGQWQVRVLAAKDFSSFIYGYPEENGYVTLHFYGSSSSVSLARNVAGVQVNASGTQAYFLQDDSLYTINLLAGRYTLPKKIAENISRFAASRTGDAVAYLRTETRFSPHGQLYFVSEGKTTLLSEDASSNFLISPNGEFIAFLAGQDIYSKQAAIYIARPFAQPQMADSGATTLFSLTNEGNLLYSKGPLTTGEGDLSAPTLGDLYAYSSKTGTASLLEEDVYLYH